MDAPGGGNNVTQTAFATRQGPGDMVGSAGPGMLAGLRVIEFADELAEYTGLLLAGLGAEVIKIEPPQGNATRGIGPFLDDIPDPEKSLFFWNYNRGKRSVVLDIGTVAGRDKVMQLLASADVLLDSTCGDVNAALGLDRAALNARFPRLVTARITPFGDDGPWAGFRGSDLIHLALGGVMKNCGYDPDPNLNYDLPPIAPQMWHAYHICGEQMAVGIIAALIHRMHTQEGQDVSCAVHEAVAKNPELDVMSWVMQRTPLWRLTCRHATAKPNHSPAISHTKDGRWYIGWGVGARDQANLIPFLEKYNAQADLQPPEPDANLKARNVPGSAAGNEKSAHILEVVQRFIRSFRYEDMPWPEAQARGLLWAPLRKPHENALDEHWLIRQSFQDVEHPELGKSFRYPTSKWLSSATSWQVGRRAPLLGEDTDAVLAAIPAAAPSVPARVRAGGVKNSAHGKPFPLQGVRILDFSWFLASAGGTRFLAGLGAESLKVEWKENPDTRLAAMAPVGGRQAREKATAPLQGVTDADMGGQFNNKNAGKRGVSLNIRDPRGLDIAKRLIKISDIVAEGFSPGVLDRLGLGYNVQKEIKSDIIYIQQAGMGAHGKYGRLRTVGPVAAAFSGTADMSGLPEPAMPVGWGYSYLDWMGAYGYALALMGALYHRDRTGEGQWIDASQCESGIFLTGVSVLDWSANDRVWQRFGNRSPYKRAAPHGAYRCAGTDRWIAIACFTDDDFSRLAHEAGQPGWITDKRFATLASRLAHQDLLEQAIIAWTATQDDYELMHRLQAAGIAAGACQDAQDRCDRDPQLAHLRWLTEVTGTKIGTWPVNELPMKLSSTPAHAGGTINRGAPNYGEHNDYMLGELLGFTTAQIRQFAEDNVI